MSIDDLYVLRSGEKRNPCPLLVGMQVGAATVESSMEIPQKKMESLPYDLVIPLVGIYPNKPET